MTPYPVLIDIAASDLTQSQVMSKVSAFSRMHPEMEVFMDGDQYAVVYKPREECA